MRKVLAIALILALVIFAPGCSILFLGDGWNLNNYTGVWSGTYDFTAGHLMVAGSNGSITVEVWDRDEVRADAHWTAKTDVYQFFPKVEESDGVLSLKLPSDRELSGVSWTVQVPQGLDVTARTSNGRITLLGDGYGAVTADTSNGRVVLEGSGQDLLYVNTSNGSVDVARWTGEEVDITTSNGSITAHLGKIDKGMYSLSSSNGSFRVFVQEDSAFDLSASTSNGRINSELGGSWSPAISGKAYNGAYNGGGARLVLRTSNSNIWLHRP